MCGTADDMFDRKKSTESELPEISQLQSREIKVTMTPGRIIKLVLYNDVVP